MDGGRNGREGGGWATGSGQPLSPTATTSASSGRRAPSHPSATAASPDTSDVLIANNLAPAYLDLIYMNARYYMPLVGRFISPDTIVPDPSNPQSYNRYSYIENRPLNGTDPSGHCIVAYSGDVRMSDGPYGTSGPCPNTESPITEGNAAIEAYYADPTTKSSTGEMIFWYFGAPFMVAGGTFVVAELSAAIPTVIGAGGAACGDGDCTNELRGVWNLDPFTRGVKIDTAVRRLLGEGTPLATNQPVIDHFVNGIATSIKSLNTGSQGYQNLLRLDLTVEQHVYKLVNNNGSNWANARILAGDITSKNLLLVIPPNASTQATEVLYLVQEWAQSLGINISIMSTLP